MVSARHSFRPRLPSAAAQIAAQQVAEQGREVVNRCVIPVQYRKADVAVIERKREKQPIQGVRETGLALSNERLSSIQEWIPDRKTVHVKLLRLIIQPRNNLSGEVGRFKPTVLVGEKDLPEEPNNNQQQYDGAERLSHAASTGER